MRNFQERSYSTKILRPKPFLYQDEDGSVVVIATAWGSTENSQRVSDEIVKYIQAAKSDVEVTSPFEFLTCLSDETNYLRTAILIANDIVYRGDNKLEYSSGVEVLALYKKGNQVAWAQVGKPSLLIQKDGQSLQPISMGFDLAVELGTVTEKLPPLPAQLLGLESKCHVQCGSFKVDTNDQLVLLSSTSIPASLWQKEFSNLDMEGITRRMIQDEPENPFWLGLIPFR